MTSAEFRAACYLLWGEREVYWGAKHAADFLGVTARNVFYWAAGDKEVPEGVASDLRKELRRRLRDDKDLKPELAVIRSVISVAQLPAAR